MTTGSPNRLNLLSLPAEILLQIARELYTFPLERLEPHGHRLYVGSTTWSVNKAIGPTLAELHAEAEQELQLFTLLYVNRHLRTIALGVFQTGSGRTWNSNDTTYAQRLDTMRDEEARILLKKVCGTKVVGKRHDAGAIFRAMRVEREIKAWEKEMRVLRSAAVWEKVFELAGIHKDAIKSSPVVWRYGMIEHEDIYHHMPQLSMPRLPVPLPPMLQLPLAKQPPTQLPPAHLLSAQPREPQIDSARYNNAYS